MLNRCVGLCCVAVVFLALARPVTPVVAGAGLLLAVLLSAKRGLAASSAAKRREFCKRACAVAALAVTLMIAGAHADAPWGAQIQSAAQARAAMFSLLLYCGALLGAPVIAWMHLSSTMRFGMRAVRVRRVSARAQSSSVQRSHPVRGRLSLLGQPNMLHGHYTLCHRKVG